MRAFSIASYISASTRTHRTTTMTTMAMCMCVAVLSLAGAYVPPPRPALLPPHVEAANVVLRRVATMHAAVSGAGLVRAVPAAAAAPDAYSRFAAAIMRADAAPDTAPDAAPDAHTYTPPETYIPCGCGFSNSRPPAWADA